jgi:hypothetical protein
LTAKQEEAARRHSARKSARMWTLAVRRRAPKRRRSLARRRARKLERMKATEPPYVHMVHIIFNHSSMSDGRSD